MLSYCKTEKEDRVYIFLRQNKGTKKYRYKIKTAKQERTDHQQKHKSRGKPVDSEV